MSAGERGGDRLFEDEGRDADVFLPGAARGVQCGAKEEPGNVAHVFSQRWLSAF